jgi:excisionase family DNA binding protein
MTDPVLLRPAQVAELLQVSRTRVYDLARSGQLPGLVRLGGSLRVHAPTLLKALEEDAARGVRGSQ